MPGPGWFAYMQGELEKEERARKRAENATSERCPKCGSILYKRESKYGKFLGCGNYPNCKHTQKIKEDNW